MALKRLFYVMRASVPSGMLLPTSDPIWETVCYVGVYIKNKLHLETRETDGLQEMCRVTRATVAKIPSY